MTEEPQRRLGPFLCLLLLLSAKRVDGVVVEAVDAVNVVDANGTKVAGVLGLAGPAGATIALEVDGQLVVLQVTREHFVGNADTDLLFESNNCTGTAYAAAGSLSLGPSLTAVVVGSPGSTVYLGDPGSTPQAITSRSQLGSPISRPGPCHQDTILQPDAISVTPTINLDTLFTPPFTLAAAPTPTVEPPRETGTPSPTRTPTSPEAPTRTGTHTSAPTPTRTGTMASLRQCCGDCNANGIVTVDELVTAVNYALKSCPSQ